MLEPSLPVLIVSEDVIAVTDSDPPAASLYFPEFRGATEIIENWSREPKSVLSQ